MGSIPDKQRRTIEAEKAWRIKDLESLVNLCSIEIEAAAHQEAFSFALPWKLAALRDAGKHGVLLAARDKNKYDPLGAPFQQRAWRWIVSGARSKAEGLHATASAGGGPEPTPNQRIRDALGEFTTQEWRALIREFERRDLDTLRSYLDANKESLIQWLGMGKFNAMFCQAMERHFVLFLRQPGVRSTETTQAFWAAYVQNDARERNIAGEPRPSIKRSWAEVALPPAISEGLSTRGDDVSSYKVRMMLERMDQTSLEEFDGGASDYFFWATDPKAYKRHLRMRKTPARLRRDPDPYFFQHN